jgi:acyl-CoA thioesterase FadM
VSAEIEAMKHASLVMRHEIRRAEELLAEVSVAIVRVDLSYRPRRLSGVLPGSLLFSGKGQPPLIEKHPSHAL